MLDDDICTSIKEVDCFRAMQRSMRASSPIGLCERSTFTRKLALIRKIVASSLAKLSLIPNSLRKTLPLLQFLRQYAWKKW